MGGVFSLCTRNEAPVVSFSLSIQKAESLPSVCTSLSLILLSQPIFTKDSFFLQNVESFLPKVLTMHGFVKFLVKTQKNFVERKMHGQSAVFTA